MRFTEGRARLVAIMAARGMTQRDIQREVGISSDGIVTRWVTDDAAQVRRPSGDMRVRLQTALGIPVTAWSEAEKSR